MAFWRQLRNWLWAPGVLLWPGCDVVLKGGQELHLAGSMHMGTPDMAPLPQMLLDRLASATALIVEADVFSGGSPFNGIATCEPLQQRLNVALYQQLIQRIRQLQMAPELLDTKPAWLVALILQVQQAQRLGFRAEYGIDYQLLQAARQQQKKVLELEGGKGQLALLQQLPEQGAGLLRDVLQHWHSNARLLQRMADCWIAGAGWHNILTLPEVFSGEQHDVLLRQRNQQWCQFLNALPAGRYIVAVGALHLYGQDNLPALLR